jgi:hypothetical protein
MKKFYGCISVITKILYEMEDDSLYFDDINGILIDDLEITIYPCLQSHKYSKIIFQPFFKYN